MSTDNAHVEEAETGKEIKESVDRAQMALNRVDNVTKRQAQAGNNPEETQDYWSALMDCDMAVHDAYSRLRKYLRVDQEKYWNTYIIGYDDGAAIVLGGYDGEPVNIDDLQVVGGLPTPAQAIDGTEEFSIEFFESFQGAVETRTVTRRERFGEEEEVTEHVPKLLLPNDYRRALQILDEVRRKLGFTPTPTESTPRTEITQEMIDDVEEWRRENLPDKYLPDEVYGDE